MGHDNRVHRILQEAERGVIYDRHGVQLVTNRAAWALSVIPAALPSDARERQTELFQAASLSGRPEPEVAALIAHPVDPYTPVLLRQSLTPEQSSAARERLPQLPGLRLDQRSIRTYVDPLVFGHVLGFTAPVDGEDLKTLAPRGYRADETVGKAGVEAGLESILRGQDGWADTEFDSSGQTVRIVRNLAPVPGRSVYLSIDAGLQRAASQALDESLRKLHKQAGAALVVDPGNGELLAMVSLPGLDTNLFTNGVSGADYKRLLSDPAKPLYDRALNGLYPPGSTFKMITAAAALQEGKISAASSLGCPPSISYGGWVYRNWAGYDMGAMNVVKAIALSCDTFFYRVADSVGDVTLASYARAFGYGVAPEFQIPGASAGAAPDRNWLAENCQPPFDCRWNPGETLTMGIGQSFLLTTPLIQSMYVSALANSGTLYRPNLLHQVVGTAGQVVARGQAAVAGQVPVSAENMAVVRAGMRQCLADPHGTGYQFRNAGWKYDGGCKTGTAQFGGSGVDLPTHSWFTFFTPFQNPEIAMVTFVEGGGEGDEVAEPIGLRIAQYYMAHRGSIRE